MGADTVLVRKGVGARVDDMTELRSSELKDSARCLMNGLYRGRGGSLNTGVSSDGDVGCDCCVGRDGDDIYLLRRAGCKREALERAGRFKGLRRG